MLLFRGVKGSNIELNRRPALWQDWSSFTLRNTFSLKVTATLAPENRPKSTPNSNPSIYRVLQGGPQLTSCKWSDMGPAPNKVGWNFTPVTHLYSVLYRGHFNFTPFISRSAQNAHLMVGFREGMIWKQRPTLRYDQRRWAVVWPVELLETPGFILVLLLVVW